VFRQQNGRSAALAMRGFARVASPGCCSSKEMNRIPVRGICALLLPLQYAVNPTVLRAARFLVPISPEPVVFPAAESPRTLRCWVFQAPVRCTPTSRGVRAARSLAPVVPGPEVFPVMGSRWICWVFEARFWAPVLAVGDGEVVLQVECCCSTE
jgi:hypothetical protein